MTKDLKLRIINDNTIKMLQSVKCKFIESNSRFYVSNKLNDKNYLYMPKNAIILSINELIIKRTEEIEKEFENNLTI